MHRRLGSGELSAIAEKLFQGVPKKDRRVGFRMYKQTFQGTEAVEFFLEEGLAPHDVSAVELGQHLLAAGVIKQAVDSSPGSPGFKNSASALYTFSSSLLPQASIDETSPREMVLEEEDVTNVVSALRQGLVIKDRTVNLRKYKDCFEGVAAVKVLLTTGLATSEEWAVAIGNALMQEELIQHVNKNQSFKNTDSLYRFTPNADKYMTYNTTPSSLSSRRSLDGSPVPTVSPSPRPLDSGPLTPPQTPDGDPFSQLITQSSRRSTEGGDVPGPLPVALPSGGRASWAEGKSQASFITRGGTTLSGQAFEHSGRRQALDMVHLHEFQQPLNCCNITAIAFAIAALSVPTTVEDVFHYADLPAQMIIDAGLTLADTFQVACRYVEGRNLPFRVELFFFDEGRLSEQDFAEQVAEVSLRRAASSKDVDMYLLNFNVNIAHGIQEGVAIGGGHFALLGGWDTDGHLVIADVNPKKYLRYWRCTPNRMFRAMQDKDSTSKRSRGCIRITHKDNPYTNPWPQEAVWNPPGIHKGIAGVDERSLHAPIACGNVTAIAYALSAIGKKTSVDDIFHTAQLPLRAVTDGNMTLADTFHTMVEVVQTRQLPVKVEIYHMDDNKILPETFWRCMIDAVANQDTAVILNFDIDTALGAKVNITSHASGGEYALVAAVNKEKEEVILASVQPRSYARYWRCAVGRLFAACKKRDLSIGRGRGMIRVVSKTSTANQAPAPSRLNSAFVCEAADSALTAYNMAKMANSAERRASTYERRQSTLRRNPGIPRAPSRAQSRNLTPTDSMSPKVMSILGLEGDPSGAAPGGVPRVQSVRARPPEPMPSIMERPGRYDVPVNISEEEEHDGDKAAAGANAQPVDGLPSDEEEEEDEDDMVGEHGSDPVALAEALGVYSGKPDRPFLFFTYGTLKQGFANRGQFEEALHDFVGPRVTKESLPLVVPTLPSCTNAGCRLLHRACTLLDAPGQGSGQVMGELYAIDKVTLDAFDILENFLPDDLANSSYIRKPTAICKADGSDQAKCLMYYSAQTSQKLEEVDKGIASCVTEYTLDMAASQGYKRCCLMNYDHEGPHWHWDGPPPPKKVVAWDGPKANVLVGSAASSAADKLPALVEELLATGKFNVKVVPSENSRHFFRDGMRVLTSVLKEDDIYYDHHEWNFEYTFGMPVIARHLWLRDWADILIIAPMTCNTLGKICHGVGDNLLTSVVSAWEWKKKPFIAAPAMNSIMFDSPVCQRNLKTLTELGATVMGPRKARLSNGKIGVGAMTLIEDIVRFADEATTEATKLPSAPTLAEVKSSVTGKERWRLKVKALAHAMAISGWLSHSALLSAFRNAANSDKGAEAWKPVLASIQSMPRINFRSESGDTALHFAAGGEGLTSSAGEYIQGNGNVDAVKLLIQKGADVNAANQYGFTPLHVAISNKLSGIVRVLLKSGADPLIWTIKGCPRPYVLAVEKQDPRTLACFVLWEEDDESRKLPEADEIEKEKAEGDAMVQMDADAVAIS